MGSISTLSYTSELILCFTILCKEAAQRSEPYQLYRVLLTGKAFLSYVHVAPSLKHLSQT